MIFDLKNLSCALVFALFLAIPTTSRPLNVEKAWTRTKVIPTSTNFPQPSGTFVQPSSVPSACFPVGTGVSGSAFGGPRPTGFLSELEQSDSGFPGPRPTAFPSGVEPSGAPFPSGSFEPVPFPSGCPPFESAPSSSFSSGFAGPTDFEDIDLGPRPTDFPATT
ncbi:hypothetical protein FA15DRAFT_708228 [Coprinopsis marcescibilis]|uniref:Uncharacterized protein n=1 Tax=Coprinopsis marcescibilis TaxID=230819 RepID=A0A5C3KK88_COPMA|nr:hypothetical protein FA15DRAFT_708228 [Coprinopsis marcescibilis]